MDSVTIFWTRPSRRLSLTPPNDFLCNLVLFFFSFFFFALAPQEYAGDRLEHLG